MLYITEMTRDTMDVVNSKTLEYKVCDYETVYKMLLEGIEIKNIYVSSLFTEKGTGDKLSLSKECLLRHGGICKADVSEDTDTFIDADKPIPIARNIIPDLDFSVILDNVIIRHGMFEYYVWYNNKFYMLSEAGIAGFFLLSDTLMVSHRLGGIIEVNYVPIEWYRGIIRRYECSRSQFMREILLS